MYYIILCFTLYLTLCFITYTHSYTYLYYTKLYYTSILLLRYTTLYYIGDLSGGSRVQAVDFRRVQGQSGQEVCIGVYVYVQCMYKLVYVYRAVYVRVCIRCSEGV